MTAANVRQGHDELIARIRSAGDRWKRRTATVGLLRVAAVFVVAFALVVGLEALVVLPPAVRLTLLVVAAAAIAAALPSGS